MIAIDAYGICSSSAAASAAGPFSRRAAGAAGAARITASASRYSGSAAAPIVSRQPDAVLVSSRTIALTRMSAPEALATASGSAPSPVVRVTKSGAGFLLLSADGLVGDVEVGANVDVGVGVGAEVGPV